MHLNTESVCKSETVNKNLKSARNWVVCQLAMTDRTRPYQDKKKQLHSPRKPLLTCLQNFGKALKALP